MSDNVVSSDDVEDGIVITLEEEVREVCVSGCCWNASCECVVEADE